MVASYDLFCHKSNSYFTLDLFGEHSHSLTIFISKSALITHLPHQTLFSLHFIVLQMLDPQYLSIYLFSWITPWFWSYLPLDIWFSKFHPAHFLLIHWWNCSLKFFYLPFWTYLALLYFSKYLVSPFCLFFLSKWMSLWIHPLIFYSNVSFWLKNI